ncbi:unnamed protein product [Paramecium sonneborni]|uniref:Uncharacterized protein n=1 Tax=Paramecium sonneborni TaxID=65129 RepID=A0A8S1MWQ0_9CILI|nr:unnamed protein product [Paramecium sonneborni]
MESNIYSQNVTQFTIEQIKKNVYQININQKQYHSNYFSQRNNNFSTLINFGSLQINRRILINQPHKIEIWLIRHDRYQQCQLKLNYMNLFINLQIFHKSAIILYSKQLISNYYNLNQQKLKLKMLLLNQNLVELIYLIQKLKKKLLVNLLFQKFSSDSFKQTKVQELFFQPFLRKSIENQQVSSQKLFFSDEFCEIELCLTSDFGNQISENLPYQGSLQIQKLQENQQFIFENEIIGLKQQIEQLQTKTRIENEKLLQQIIEYQDQMKEHQNVQMGFDDLLKLEQESRSEISQKYKELLQLNNNLKYDIMEKENQIEDLQYQLRIVEAEKKFNKDQEEKLRKGQEIMVNNNQFQDLKIQIADLIRLQKEQQFEMKKNNEVIDYLQKLVEEYKNKIKELIYGKSQAEQKIDTFREELEQSHQKCQYFTILLEQYKGDVVDLINKYIQSQSLLSEQQENFNLQNQTVISQSVQIQELKQKLLIKDMKEKDNLQLQYSFQQNYKNDNDICQANLDIKI